MTGLLERTAGFFVENFPSWQALLLGGPLALAWSLACLWIAARLKSRGWPTGYTRKVFHFLGFGSAAVLQWRLGTPAVCLFGAMCSLVVLLAIWRGAGDGLYEALARQKDAPRRTYFIVLPYLATLVGGLASNILFGPAALAGYLVTGLGDAVGEPVGTRIGRHPYRVPSRAGVPATRTLEGSAAVFLASGVALLLAALLSPSLRLAPGSAWQLPLLALGCAVTEAVSPHGWDNATMQVIPTAMAWAWMAG